MDDTPSTRDLLIQLNTYARTQMSTLYIFKTGIIYGVGFVVGSTIVAAILINTSLLLFGEFPLVQTIVHFIQGQ
ncbi:MAG: hypothetical protein RLZZ342_697 [Candidatus Parcubacteria bacterium]|jgi:GTPase